MRVITALKKIPSIKAMIHERVAGWEPSRDDGYVHASDLLKEQEFCPREWALRHLLNVKLRDTFLGTSQVLTFDHGRDLEKRIRNEYLRDVVVGKWGCEACKNIMVNWGHAPQEKCGKCGYGVGRYVEPQLISPSTGVGCSIDVIVMANGKLRIVEIKSIDKDYFEKLKAPMAEHKFRTSLYLRIAAEVGLDKLGVNVKEAHVLYTSKAFGLKDFSLKEVGIKDSPFSPFKEYLVVRDDTLTDSLLSRAKVVKLIEDFPEVGMPCGVCSSGFIKRAQQCSVVQQCWGGSYPGMVTWEESGKPRHFGKKVL